MRFASLINQGLIVGMTLGFVTSGRSSGASDSDGRALYEEMCARCHGSTGQGVEGHYEETLTGTLSLERLVRRIHRTMPEDKPELCEDQKAEAVAGYIYDAFYSPEAQARLNPARVELVRLTNRQYLNAVADLLAQFGGAGERPGGEQGLRATYYNHKDFRHQDLVEERLDARLDFESQRTGLHPAQSGTNGFSVRWRGSVLADETGDYEFILKTPNGARLWVNNEEEELIDAGVASGMLDEHKATLHLLGGRLYPLRLDWFQFKEQSASLVLQWKPPYGAQETIPTRNLRPIRSRPTLVVCTPFPADDSSVGYERGVSISKAWDEATTYAAIEVANAIVDNLDKIVGSKPGETNRTQRVNTFCINFAGHAFRRPLNKEETERYVEARFQESDSLDRAVKRVVILVLKSPRFLYLGLENEAPDDYTVAARLSFGLWDSLPDRELWKLAGAGRLHSRETVVQQAERMLNDPRARSKMLNSLHHWLQVSHGENLSKDPQLFPDFTPELAADLRTSLNLFLEEVIWTGESDYRNLLLSDEVFVNERLARYYGVAPPRLGEWTKVKLDPAHRAGVLTHPYLLAAFAYPGATSPIHRGVFLTRNIIGRSLKPPPMAVAFKDADFDPKMTMREKVADLTRSQACQACHAFINPLGFSLENFDAVGRYRTEDNSRPVDTVGDYTTESGEVVHLVGARDVATFAAGNANAQKAFIEQMFHQVVKQPVQAYGSDTMTQLYQSFVASGYNVQSLLVEISTIAALYDINPLTASTSTP